MNKLSTVPECEIRKLEGQETVLLTLFQRDRIFGRDNLDIDLLLVRETAFTTAHSDETFDGTLTVRTSAPVADEVPLTQAEKGNDSATTNQKQISETPNLRNALTYIAQTTAFGVVMNTDTPGDTLR